MPTVISGNQVRKDSGEVIIAKTGQWIDAFHFWEGSFAPRAGQIHPQSDQQGAGEPVSREVNRQTSVAAGLPPDANQEFVDRQNAQLDAGNFSAFLDNYQQSVLDNLDGGGLPQLTDGGNLALDFDAIKSRLEPSTARPDAFSRVGKFEELRGEFGVADLEEQLNNLKAQQRDAEAQLRINVGAEREKPVAQGVIERRIGEHTRQSREDLEFINRQQAFLTDQLNSAYQVINTYVQFGAADYQDAVEIYNSEFNKNLQLMGLSRELRKDQISEQQRQIDNSRANLSTFVNAITSGNLSPSQISADQKLQIRKLEVQSGLPVGFVERLQMSPQDQLVTLSKDETQAILMDGSGNFRTVDTGARAATSLSGTGTGSERAAVVEQTQRDEMNSLLESKANSFGDVPYQFWNEGKRLWLLQGLDGEDYDSIYGNYVDQNRVDDKSNVQDYNLE